MPNHKRRIQIVRLKKLFTNEFDLYKITESIIDNLKFETEIRIGISILVQAGAQAELIRYYFSIFNRPLNPIKMITHSKDRNMLLNYLKPLSKSDILNLTFSQINQQNAFEKSDFRPRKLVLATFWLTRNRT